MANVPPICVSSSLEPDGYKWYFSIERPSPIVGLVGCTQYHEDFLELLESSKQQTNSELVINLFALEHPDMIRKKKENSGPETSAPEGLLRADWCKRHQTEVFGCVVVLINIDDFSTRESFESGSEAIVGKVQYRLRGRLTKLLVVVVTSADRIPFYEKPESCPSSIRKRCDIDAAKNVTICSMSHKNSKDSLKKILQTAQDFSLTYYKEESRRIKRFKEVAHKNLQPRHRFKIAFHMETQRQVDLSLKYYSQAYEYVRLLSSERASATEIKAASEVIMFRICLTRLLYDEVPKMGAVIKLFREHIHWYRTCSEHTMRGASSGSRSRFSHQETDSAIASPKLSSFRAPLSPSQSDFREDSSTGRSSQITSSTGVVISEQPSSPTTLQLPSRSPTALLRHFISVARQHDRFAWLLEKKAARGGAQTSTSDGGEYSNPGYYLQCAAFAVEDRKNHVLTQVALHGEPDPCDESVLASNETYLGQLWGGEHTEINHLTKLLQYEKRVSYENEMLAVCAKAKQAFYKRGLKRVSHSISLLMVRCCISLQQYDEADKQLDEVLQSLQKCPFGQYFDSALQLKMELSKNANQTQDFIQTALLYLSNYNLLETPNNTPEARQSLLANILRISNYTEGSVPVSWNHRFVRSEVRFNRPSVPVHTECELEVRLSTCCAFPILIDSLTLTFSPDDVSIDQKVNEVIKKGSDFTLRIPRTFELPGIVQLRAVIVNVGLEGIPNTICIIQQAPPCNDLLSRIVSASNPYPYHEEVTFPSLSGMPRKPSRTAISVQKPVPDVELHLKHVPPALLGEAYTVVITVAPQKQPILSGSIMLPSGDDFRPIKKYDVKGLSEGSTGVEFMLENEIKPGEEATMTVDMKFDRCGKFSLGVVLSYATAECKDMQLISPMELNIVTPVKLLASVTDSLTWSPTGHHRQIVMNPHRMVSWEGVPAPTGGAENQTELFNFKQTGGGTTVMRTRQPCTFTVTAVCDVETYDIIIHDIKLISHKGANLLSNSTEIVSDTLCYDEQLSRSWQLEPRELSVACKVQITATRVGSEDKDPFSFPVSLPRFAIQDAPVVMMIESPTSGCMGEVITIKVHLQNHRNTVSHVTCEVQDKEEKHFLWSGRSSWTLSILPGKSSVAEYHLIPVFPGMVRLPVISLLVQPPAQGTSPPTPIITPTEAITLYIAPSNTTFRSQRDLTSS
eukprot:TRINITY_DN16457_c0_g1_i1.p1 TRINITY_DN16457_c0_g1~~TRINITY_DN16457_c0_g1_i1.p1  ORF type:complete len:1193 (+),score=182.86 TRINITY_DN16457_c0_g1_i1:73-3651(+)